MIIETHCHLDYLKSDSIDALIQKAKDVGIEKIITIGVDPDNLDVAQRISDEHDLIYFSQGIHPHDAKNASGVEFQKIISRSSLKKMVAVGEIGLDYHYDNSPRDIQRKVFETQLQIASDHNLPVIIHTREADEDTMDILKNFTGVLKKRGVVHSFTSGKILAEWVLRENFYLGFNGIITFKKAENVQEIVRMTPLQQILTETDSPFLTPVPHRGKENAPHYLPYVIGKIAELKNENLDNVIKVTFENALKCFQKLGN